MDEHQYLRSVEKIRDQIRAGELQGVMERLDRFASVKPVRLKWIVAKAEAMMALEYPIDEIYLFIQDKGWNVYDYPDLKDYYRLYEKLAEATKDGDDRIRCQNSVLFQEEGQRKAVSEGLKRVRADFLDCETAENAMALLASYYFLDDPVMYLLLSLYLDKKEILKINRPAYLEFGNSGFVKEILSKNSDIPFLVIADTESIGEDCSVMIRILNYFGKQVFWLGRPLICSVDNAVKIEDTVSVTIENREFRESAVLYHPIELYCGEEYLGDNRDYVIKELVNRAEKNKGFAVFTSGRLMDQLCARPALKTLMQRLSTFRNPLNETEMAFGWAGSALPYLRLVHCMDVEAELSREAECEFSIVIPARNSSKTLKYTIMTCLNQRFKGKYEIVISDNSSPGNTEVYKLYKNLASPIVKYYKTPREYNLSKSFEYAILCAKGEFIMPIGSDDGVLPWALTFLSEVRRDYPAEEVICWDRGFYAWPGFNGMQQNQFVIPREYRKEGAVFYQNSKELIKSALKSPAYLYSLPMLYINSGFKRTFLKRLLEKTGSLWDGVSQDAYMAAVSCLITDHCLYAVYPVTIAGMSSSSVGAQSMAARQSAEEDLEHLKEVSRTGNIGAMAMSAVERLLPMTGRDIICFYNSLLRASSKGILPLEALEEELDWKKMFLEAADGLNVLDIQFDRLLHYCRYTASLHGTDFLKWFDREIYRKKLRPITITDEQIDEMKKQQVYIEGETEGGGCVRDASKDGVTDIFGAVKLFEKLSGL